MGWTYKHRQYRDALRKQYAQETGREWSAPGFAAWLQERGLIPADQEPASQYQT